MHRVKHINSARLKLKIREQLQEITERLEGMLRSNVNGEEWVCDGAFMERTAIVFDKLVDELCFLVLERASQRSKSTTEFTVIEQDVLDAFDVYRAIKKE